MKKVHGKEATAAYSPKEGHAAAVYRMKFKPECFRDALAVLTNDFIDAQVALKQKRHNIFLKCPSTHEIVNISFFDEGASVSEWHEGDDRMKAVEKLAPMLDGPIDVHVYEVAQVVGTSV